jgi:protein ImuB
MRLFRERIDSLADPLDPGFGFDAIALAVSGTEPLAARQIDLEGTGEDAGADSIAALIDRLTTRLGPDSVLRLSPSETHIPESGQRLGPAMPPAPPAWPNTADRPPRPLFLLDPPQPIIAIASVPDGPPQRFRWRGRPHEIRMTEGPERIAPEWWRWPEGHLPGGGGLTRDYYRIEDAEGHRFWVFRHGLFGETPNPRWYLHGLFP